MSVPSQNRIIRSIPGCLIHTDIETMSSLRAQASSTAPLPALLISCTLRISFDPARGLALFRLAATVGTSPQPFYLDIMPHQIRRLTLYCDGGHPTHLRFDATTINFIAPKRLLVPPDNNADLVTIKTLRSLALQPALHAVLPADLDGETLGVLLPQLRTVCDAVNQGRLSPDPHQMDLKTLYQGQGGRIIQAHQGLWGPLAEPVPAMPAMLPPKAKMNDANSDENYDDDDEDGDDHHNDNGCPFPPQREAPPPQLFANWGALDNNNADDNDNDADGDSYIKQPPPAYADDARVPGRSTSPPRTIWNKNKRRRSTSSSDSPDSSGTLRYRTYRHLDLAVGEREKMMAELLRRVRISQQDLDAKCARADELAARLTDLISRAEQQKEDTTRGQARSISATPVAAAPSPGSLSTASAASSAISDRIQAYVERKLQDLRTELATEYATPGDVNQRVAEELDAVLCQYVEEHQMFDAIQEAVDEAVNEVRGRVLQAWG
ncbi:hypothetical protein FJTKL_03638 [Diaporthe vaccinii]|uniref:Uncharacterized protein n=1 Tax=Diaporthe vaccinii TaxID=105482 RepID=A0ABR4DUY8_9PEZI